MTRFTSISVPSFTEISTAGRGVAAVGIRHRDAAEDALAVPRCPSRPPSPPHPARRDPSASSRACARRNWYGSLPAASASSSMKHSRKIRIVGMRHRAPRSEQHVRVAHGVFQRVVRHAVGRVDEHARADLIDAVLQELREHRGRDRWLRLANVPADPVAVLVECAAQLDERRPADSGPAPCLPRATTAAAPACPAWSARS